MMNIVQLEDINEPLKTDALVARLQHPAEAAKLRKLKSRLIIPLRHHANLIGIFIVGTKASEPSFSSEEMTLLLLLADQMSIVLENIEGPFKIYNAYGRLVASGYDLWTPHNLPPGLYMVRAGQAPRVMTKTFVYAP